MWIFPTPTYASSCSLAVSSDETFVQDREATLSSIISQLATKTRSTSDELMASPAAAAISLRSAHAMPPRATRRPWPLTPGSWTCRATIVLYHTGSGSNGEGEGDAAGMAITAAVLLRIKITNAGVMASATIKKRTTKPIKQPRRRIVSAMFLRML